MTTVLSKRINTINSHTSIHSPAHLLIISVNAFYSQRLIIYTLIFLYSSLLAATTTIIIFAHSMFSKNI